jgi:hypothetical protein
MFSLQKIFYRLNETSCVITVDKNIFLTVKKKIMCSSINFIQTELQAIELWV